MTMRVRRCGGSHAKVRADRTAGVLLRAAGAALAFDNGQYENVPADIRAWFKGVIARTACPAATSPTAIALNMIFREGAYWVPIEGQWMQVPAHAIIRDRGNPVGEAVVWYVHHRGGIIISCFVPADAV